MKNKSDMGLLILRVVPSLMMMSHGWGKQELPLLFATVYVVLIFVGGGAIGLGNKFCKNKWCKTN